MTFHISEQMLSALDLIRKEKKERAAAFEKELKELVIKYKVELGNVQIRVLDIDVEPNDIEEN